MKIVYLIQILLIILVDGSYLFWNNLQLEPSLLHFLISTNSTLREKCLNDKHCPVQLEDQIDERCWGFEPNCTLEKSYSSELIKCSGKSEW
jgi:hypothetical protein